VSDRLRTVLADQGPQAICMYGSGQLQTEDYYTAQKLLKGCLGTNNFDANSRLCMSSAVAAYTQSLGSDGPPCCYDDLEATDCAFLIGTNTADCHPIIYNRLRKYHRKQKGKVKLIVVDPRRTPTARDADLHLQIRPGTDITLLNGIAHILLQKRWIDAVFVDECTQGFTDYAEVLTHYAPERVADICGITVKDLETVARYWGQSKRVLSLWSMGINQSSEGTAKARTLINLHLMTGQIGKAGAGPFSLTGQPNAMGGREAGGLAHILPGYRLVKNADHRHEVETAWGLPAGSIAPEPGLSAWEMMVGLEQGQVGLLWVAATNPAVSMPDIERTKAALAASPFTVYQDAYYPTETADYAHVLLPAAQWGEKTGVMTNSERTVTLCPAFRPAPGETRADWEIFAAVGRRLGFEAQFAWSSPAAVYQEFTQLTQGRVCDMAGLSHDRLAAEGPIQWPCPRHETDATASEKHDKRLYEDLIFPTPNGRARFAAFHERGLAEPPDPSYPFILTTGRLYGHWHTQTRTGRIEKIQNLHPVPELEVNPIDAQHLRVQTGDWVEVRSRRGVHQGAGPRHPVHPQGGRLHAHALGVPVGRRSRVQRRHPPRLLPHFPAARVEGRSSAVGGDRAARPSHRCRHQNSPVVHRDGRRPVPWDHRCPPERPYRSLVAAVGQTLSTTEDTTDELNPVVSQQCQCFLAIHHGNYISEVRIQI
jgi:ferredoxin-nitrate reductase